MDYEMLRSYENTKYTPAGDLVKTIFATFMVGKFGPYTAEVPKDGNWSVALQTEMQKTADNVTRLQA